MTKKEFMSAIEPLGMIVSVDTSTGVTLTNIYHHVIADEELKQMKLNYPEIMHLIAFNTAALQERTP